MSRNFPNERFLIEYVRGRIDGLAHTTRFPMPEDIQQDLLNLTQLIGEEVAKLDKCKYEDIYT